MGSYKNLRGVFLHAVRAAERRSAVTLAGQAEEAQRSWGLVL